MDTASALLTLADGRGSSPGDLGGILIIAGIILFVAAAGFVGHLIIHKGFLRNRGTAGAPDEHRPGRLGGS